jgi:hypothetical protein
MVEEVQILRERATVLRYTYSACLLFSELLLLRVDCS